MSGLGPAVFPKLRARGVRGRNGPVVQVEWKVSKGKKRDGRLKYWLHFR